MSKEIKAKKYQVGSFFINPDKGQWGWTYSFSINKEISTKQFEKVLAAIEAALNAE